MDAVVDLLRDYNLTVIVDVYVLRHYFHVTRVCGSFEKV